MLFFLNFNFIKDNKCENCISILQSIDWFNEICENCFGTVKNNIARIGSMELLINNKYGEQLKIGGQVKCASHDAENWSWPVETVNF